MQTRAVVLDYLWQRLGAAARTGDAAQVERLWTVIDGLERLSEAQARAFMRWLEAQHATTSAGGRNPAQI